MLRAAADLATNEELGRSGDVAFHDGEELWVRLRPMGAGIVRAAAEVVHSSKRLVIAEGILYNSNEKVAARGSGKFMPSGVKLTPEIGYK